MIKFIHFVFFLIIAKGKLYMELSRTQKSLLKYSPEVFLENYVNVMMN